MQVKAILLLIVILFSPVFSYGQKANKKITISGIVTDINKKPVTGAVIFIDKVKTDIMTNEQGFYKIKVKPDAQEILVFTLLYVAEEELINGRTKIDFILSGKTSDQKIKDETKLDEPAGAGAVPDKKTETAGNIKVIDGQDPAFASYQDIYDMIRGRFPGVEVSGKSIKVMRSSSLNVSTEPLFVVDGVIVNTIEDIPPQTVKSIQVLKGPEATVYGTRGSNGVIVITRLTGKDKENYFP